MRMYRNGLRAAAGLVAVALVISGCSGGGGDSTGAGEGSTDAEGTFSMQWGEPENSLIPANTTESQGHRVIEALFTGLTQYNPKTAETEMAHAESIESPDGVTYTVKLKPGWTWHDGTPVVAQDYVDAWNYAAYAPNGMATGTFLADIKGFDQTWTTDPDGDGPKPLPKPSADKLSGLAVVDENTFTVTLNGPSNLWPLKLGYTAFMPLPKAFFADPEAFGQKPIGNGPFKLVRWERNTELVVDRYDAYQGADKAKVREIVMKVYTDAAAAYADVQGGTLDFQQQVPSATLQGDKYKTDFGDRSANQPISSSTFLELPKYVDAYKNAKLRQAISMAIDRNLITEKIFNKSRVPMTGWVNSNIPGYRENVCGEFCTYNPERAKALLNEAGGFSGELSIAYNADASHQEWVDATCNSIQTSLGVKCVGKPFPTFGEFRSLVNDHKMTSMWRSGWQADYPHIENWLTPLLRTGGSSNDGLYNNPAFDAKLAEADRTRDLAAAEKLYQEAEDMLAAEMPIIPLWHTAQQSVWSDKLQNVVVDTFGELDLASVEVRAS
jgi:oligopeptide transport system substrate-binding protein